MNHIKILVSLLSFFIIVSCSVNKYQKIGNVNTDNFYYKTEFTTLKTLIVLSMELNGVQKNFLLDTGAELSVIQRDSVFGESSTIDSPSGTVNAGSEIVKSLKIGTIDFVNTFATNVNMIGINEQIQNYGGLIGQSIISKANWLINYPKKTIEISDKNLADSTFTSLQVSIKKERFYTSFSIDGKKEKSIIDLGSSSEFILAEKSKIAKYLLSNYKFEDVNRERSSLGVAQNIVEKKATIPLIKLGEIEFKDVKITIGDSKKTRIGISFFKDYLIYIDNTNKSIKIKK